MSTLTRTLGIIDREMSAIEKSLVRADAAFVNGQMTDSRYQNQIARINERAVELAQQRARTVDQLTDEAEHAEQTARFTDVRQHGLVMLPSKDVLTTNSWLRRYIRIYCSDNKIEAIVLL